MASISLFSIAIVAVLVFCNSSVYPQIIGGGVNTDFLVGGGKSGLMSVLSTRQLLHQRDIPQRKSGNNFQLTRKQQRKTSSANNENQSDVYANTDTEMPKIKFVPRSMSGTDRVNPFLRWKRQTCQPSVNLGSQVNKLVSRLNSIQYLGLNPNQTARPADPLNQPQSCPVVGAANSTWYPGREANLRSNCPWKISILDLNETAYPRYFEEAKCLCETCIHSPTMTCQNLRRNITYFVYEGCQDGLALMTKMVKEIVVGCYCASPLTQAILPVDSTDNNDLDYK